MRCLLGRNGFIGNAIAGRLVDYETVPSHRTNTIFFFSSPSSNILFNDNIGYCMRETISQFISLLDYCKEKDLYLVYPSSATVGNKNNSYARCKAILEELHLAYNIPALGLRISAGYGVGEEHKGRYASTVYQWCKEMKAGKQPVIWGDGTQTRDFIYIDDVVDNIMELVDNHHEGIVEIGTGINTTFNEVVKTINKVLDTNIEPIYIEKPKQYVHETPVKAVECKVSLEEGINRIIKSL
jgi:nucleoside-diphosphate-sugar epimerase